MTVENTQGAALHCANHPNTETILRCSRCGKPICVRCVVQTPVGGRCRECANLKKAPIFLVGPRRYAKATGYGLLAAIVGGLAWASLGNAFGLSILLLVLLGYLVGEAVSRGAEGRISRILSAMAGAFTVLSAVVGRVGVIVFSLPPEIPLNVRLQFALGPAMASLTGNLMGLLFLILAVVVAVNRVR